MNHPGQNISGTVSRETQDKFSRYHALLVKWQQAVNLVSPHSLSEATTRHFDDSAQLAALLPAGPCTLADLGSGAGFPGLVLAMMRPDITVHLVESDSKKCSFLRTVSRETGTKVTIHNQRIEAVTTAGSFVPDIITARALAPLTALLDYCRNWAQANPNLTLLLPKGAQAETEITEARQHYKFTCETIPSQTAANAVILRLHGLSPL